MTEQNATFEAYARATHIKFVKQLRQQSVAFLAVLAICKLGERGFANGDAVMAEPIRTLLATLVFVAYCWGWRGRSAILRVQSLVSVPLTTIVLWASIHWLSPAGRIIPISYLLLCIFLIHTIDSAIWISAAGAMTSRTTHTQTSLLMATGTVASLVADAFIIFFLWHLSLFYTIVAVIAVRLELLLSGIVKDRLIK